MGSETVDGTLIINGGTITVNAGGDGLDSNGSMTITGGVVTVSGSQSEGNGAIDVNGTCDFTGGVVFMTGNSGMAELPSSSTGQLTISATYSGNLAAGTEIQVLDEDGTVLYEFTNAKGCNFIAISSADFESGVTYTIQAGDNATQVTAN
jgi:hypothetical protein